jgi:tRNA A-37 threonylcarbamoyl transferase component Bud32
MPAAAASRTDFTDTSPVANQAVLREGARHAEHQAYPGGVEVAMLGQRQAPRDFASSQQPAMDSWFDDLNTDFAVTEPAQPQATSLMPPQRIQRVLQTHGEGPVDQVWATLRAYLPDPAHREATLQTCERIAAAFEADARLQSARDVYEYMADIDPHWPQVRTRLTRARALSQVSTVTTWGSVPPRPVPILSQASLGRYQIDKPLGKGAMGAVYQGHDPATGQRVAIKTMALSREFSGDELADARSRFLREADMAGRLRHPDIVGILDAGEADGLAYIAMELVEGIDLSHHAHPERLLTPQQVLRIVARVADALAYAHTRGVTHRDVKPANIMVDMARELVKVMDFGVARVADATRTRTGVVLGTPTFMSPEQLSGQPIDGRSDLYSLGVALFQLLTGQLPYPTDSMGALMRAIGREPPLPLLSLRPELPLELGDIVALALQKHPATRYASGQHMADDLRAVLRSLSA